MSYYLDRGVWFFGTTVEIEVDKAGQIAARGMKNAKSKEIHTNSARSRTLDRLLGGKVASGKRYKDPVAEGKIKL